jgi:hypothetical protein
MGFWVGRNQARKLAGGEALLGVNYDTWGTDPDYDHIMTTDAVTTSQAIGGAYNAADTMFRADGIDGTETSLTFARWVNGTRT